MPRKNQKDRYEKIRDLLINKRFIASIIVIVLLFFVVYSIIPFLSAFFGAAILGFIFRPLDKRLKNRGYSKRVSATIILIIALVVIIIPLIFIINGLINQIGMLPGQIAEFQGVKEGISEFIPFDIEITSEQIINQLMPILTESIRPLFANIICSICISVSRTRGSYNTFSILSIKVICSCTT